MWGFSFNSPVVEEAFQKQSQELVALSSIFLGITGMSISSGLICFATVIFSLPLTSSILLPIVIEFVTGGLLLLCGWKMPRVWPYLAGLSALGQLVMDVCIACVLSVIAAQSPWTSCDTLVGYFLGTSLAWQFAVMGYCNAMAGYTRARAAVVLLEPVIFLGMVLISDRISTEVCVAAPLVVLLSLVSIAFSVQMTTMLCRLLEAQQQFLQQMQKQHSVVNHVVKNALADVEAEVQLLADQGHEWYSDALFGNIKACLRRGIRWCKNFQTSLKLRDGKFIPTLHPLNLYTFGQDLIAGRSVKMSVPKVTIRTDPVLCDIVLENALDNASKHGHPADPETEFSIAVVPPPPEASSAAPAPHNVVFKVTNRRNPAKPPLAPDLLASARTAKPQRATSALSDGLGMQHCLAAADALSMTVGLRQEDEWVTFEASMEAEVCHADGLPGGPDDDGTVTTDTTTRAVPFPPDLKVYCIDDSAVQRRWLASCMGDLGAMEAFGATAEDVYAFTQAVLTDGSIAICDQNLVYEGARFYGTDLVAQLRHAGFAGLLCIHSANDAAEDTARYSASGAHLSIGKGLPRADMIAAIKQAYLDHVETRALLMDV